MDTAKQNIHKILTQKIKDAEAEIATHRTTLNRLDKKIARLTDALGEGAIDSHAYKAAVAGVRLEMANTHNKLEPLKTPSEYAVDIENVYKNLENMQVLYSNASTENKKKLLKSLFGSLVINTALETLEPPKECLFIDL